MTDVHIREIIIRYIFLSTMDINLGYIEVRQRLINTYFYMGDKIRMVKYTVKNC